MRGGFWWGKDVLESSVLADDDGFWGGLVVSNRSTSRQCMMISISGRVVM